MSDRTCPRCRADLDDDLISRTNSTACPFCGADVSELYETDVEPHEGFVEETGTSALEGPPSGSRVLVVESDADRLVVAVPPGGKSARGIGCFAVLWNGFMTLFTGAMMAAWFGGQNDMPIFAFVIVAVFWAVGIGFAYAWIRARFMTTYLLLERDRLVVQRILFGRKWNGETTLGPESRAKLDTSYSENDVPVYHVEVSGTNRTEKFGLRLGDDEKQWFVRAINEFLHGPEGVVRPGELAGFGDSEQAKISEGAESLAPDGLPADSPIRIDESYSEGLRFHLPLFTGGLRSGCTFGCGTIGVTWIGVCAAISLAGNDLFSRVAPALFSVAGFVFLLASIAANRGRITTTIDDSDLMIRWHVGPLGVGKRYDLENVEAVGIGTTMESKSNGRTTSRKLGCLVRIGSESIPLTTNHGEEIGRQVAGIVRYEIERRGRVLEDV